MSYEYDDETLQAINDNADLLAYASQTLELEKRGDNYFATCPNHTDLTPSLCFNAESNSFHCFSCGCSGKMIGYLIQYEGLDFDEAVEKASKLADIDLSTMCKSETISFLKKWKARKHLKKEKYQHEIFSEDLLSTFPKGNPKEWLDEGISRKTLDVFGVRTDPKSNRIIYPVYDINHNLINIKGRTRYKEYKMLKLPKYINYYKVGVMDYFQCLDKTKKYVKEKNEIIIFESIKSVMKAYDWGYKNCVSAEKHTLTDEQIDLLIKLRVNVVLAYDSDIDYWKENEVKENINKLKRITNVYIIEDKDNLLGGKSAKNAPADCGKEIWEKLYNNKRKAV